MILYNVVCMDIVYKNRGFSLAEVIICLLVVGIIAAITIPTLVFDVYEQLTVTQVKKVYSTLSNAYRYVRIVNGSPEDWPEFINQNFDHSLFAEKFRPFMHIMHDCKKDGNNSLCILNNQYHKFNGDSELYLNSRYDVVLADGTSVIFNTRRDSVDERYDRWGVIYVDLNGTKGPNRWGYDLFEFSIQKDNIVPTGANKGSTDRTILSNCLSTGYHCTAWVLRKENILYRRCPQDLQILLKQDKNNVPTGCF